MGSLKDKWKDGDSGKYAMIILGIIFLFFLFIGYMIPYTHDDWAWGSSIGLDRLQRAFVNYNGRWAGNLLILLITRVKIIKALAYAFSFTLIAYFTTRVADKKTVSSLLIFLVFLLCMPSHMFAEVVLWTSGFSNYIPPVAILLVIILAIKERLLSKEPKRRSLFLCVSVLLLCVIGQLFIEHITLYVVILAGLTNVLYVLKHKKPDRLLVCLLIGALLGAALMFTNGAYGNAVTSADNYQQLSLSGGIVSIAVSAVRRCFYLYIFMFINNSLTWATIGILSLLILLVNKAKYYVLASGVLIGFLFYILAKANQPVNLSNFQAGRLLEGLLCALFFLSVVYAAWTAKEIRVAGLFSLGSVVMLVAPLLFASPVEPRNFFVVHIFLIIFIITAMGYLIDICKMEAVNKIATSGAILISAICMLFYSCMISYISYSDHLRIREVNRQLSQGEKTIVISRLPFEAYMHYSSPANDLFAARFKLFYGIPAEIELEFIQHPVNAEIEK